MSDPMARARAIAASLRDHVGVHPDLYSVQVHARTALRRHQEALRAIDDAEAERMSPPGTVERGKDAAIRAQGEVCQAVIALYLAASAAQRYCVSTGESGPLGRKRLGELVASTTELRHAVMHWDDKIKRLPDTFISVNKKEILALTQERKTGQEVVSGLTWRQFENAAVRLDKWVTHKLAP